MRGIDRQFEENLERALESALDRPTAASEGHLVNDVLAEVAFRQTWKFYTCVRCSCTVEPACPRTLLKERAFV
jgi:hypothetical protein